MIQSHQQIVATITNLNQLFEGGKSAAVQKVYSTPHYIYLMCRLPGQSLNIFLGRGKGFQGLFYGDLKPGPEMRIQDNFLEYMRKNLKGTSLTSFGVDERDRIIAIPYYRKEESGHLVLFYNGSDLLFLHQRVKDNNILIFTSWNGKEEQHSQSLSMEELYSYFDSVGRLEKKFEGASQKSEGHLDQYFAWFEDRLKGRKPHKRKVKFFTRKIDRIRGDLTKVSGWQEIQEKLIQNQIDLESVTEFKHNQLKIKFKKADDQFRRRDHLFSKIKGWKKAQGILEKRLREVEEDYQNYLDKKERWPLPKFKLALPKWDKKPRLKISKEAQGSEIIEFILRDGIKGAVGKGPSGNQYLRSRWGKKEDYWFHLEGYPSAHIVLKIEGLSQLNPEDYNALASLLVHQSKLSIREIPLIFTQVKNLRGVKGQPGAVLFKKERHLRAEFISHWMEIIALI